MSEPTTHPPVQHVISTRTFWGIIKDTVVHALPQIIAGASFFVIFLIIALVLKWIICWGAKKGTQKRLVKELIGKSVRMLFILLGLIVGLGTAGFDVSTLVVSLGLVGFALGYAFKDVITNVLAGALIIFNKTFQIGDTVTVNNFTGDVKDINMRYTILDNDEKSILIPNSVLMTAISTIDH